MFIGNVYYHCTHLTFPCEGIYKEFSHFECPKIITFEIDEKKKISHSNNKTARLTRNMNR